MTEYNYHYNNLFERKEKVVDAETLGLQMLYDNFDPDWQPNDEPHGVMVFTDVITPSPITIPPYSTHLSTLVSVTTGIRPARVKRVWQGKDYFYDCYVSQTVKDEYASGKIVVGDYVLVHFDTNLNEQIVTAKVYKSW